MRLGDSLRGAADGAPVDDVHVSAVEAARRVQRRRTVRTSGFGALAMGGVALLAVGVVAPNLGSTVGSDSSDVAGSFSEESREDGAAADSSGTMLAVGYCGGTIDGLAYGTPTVELEGSWAVSDDAPSEGFIDVSATTRALEEVTLQSGRPTTYAYVLWDGIIVGTYPGPDQAFTSDIVITHLDAGESTTDVFALELVNCWDGEPLPAGDYEVVLAQQFWSDSPVPEPDLTDESAPDGSSASDGVAETEGSVSEPAVEPTVDPDAAVSSGIAADQGFRIVSEPLELTIDGDAVDEPFAEYLGIAPSVEPTSVTPGESDTPDGLLTPDIARSLYEDGLTGAWDMLEGTQRVALSDSTTSWEPGWFGCPYDDSETTFPAQSAVMDLLAVDVDVPSTLDVSYGWVVDGNPEVDVRVTNASEWTLPYWDSTQPTLLLVRDGIVVAEAYPDSTDRGGDVWITSDAAAWAEADDDSMSTLVVEDSFEHDYLGAGEATGETFLWREISTCDYSSDLEAGIYTVVDQHSISVFSEDYDDWADLTVWTSLGEVTVNAS